MATSLTPTIFLSHSHRDRPVARRLVRRLTAHGIKVWIDQRELRPGNALTSSIRSHIQKANMLLVVASQASAESKWVGLELEFAREHDKAIIPFFIDPLAEHERFKDYLGVDATLPQAFAEGVHGLMRDLYLSVDLELPAADSAVLTAGLRELAKEEPDLAPLILGCLDSEGLHQESRDTVYKAAFHPLDEALDALFDLMPQSAAYASAYGFSLAGAGTRSLFSWINRTGDGEQQLVTAVGNGRLEPALVPTALKLLEACDPPNNHALYNFIHHNAAQLDDSQRRAVLRLVTWPVRNDTSRLADVLGWVALKYFPDAVEVQQMWVRWVHAGAFDGQSSSPTDLARYLADAHKEGQAGWASVNDALRNHVRTYVRSGDKNKVTIATDHVRAVADAGAPVLSTLLAETTGASGSAEWNNWEKSDRETAEWMGWYVFNVAKEATGDRNWLRAWEGAEQMVAFEKKRRRVLSKESIGPDE